MESEHIEASLHIVADAVGDPCERVYARLFRAYPDFEALFVMDTDGGVRRNMFATSLKCILGIAEGSNTPRLLIEAARMHHDSYGLGHKEIDVMFEVMRDEFRDVVAERWTRAMEEAWSDLLSDLSTIGIEAAQT